MSKTPIVDALSKYIKDKNAPFSMPGHKSGRGFVVKDNKDMQEIFLSGDITEVEGLDNLHNCDGIIKESQELLAKLYGAYKSYFLVNGSTSGNLAMIFSCFNEGDSIIVERNCHRSITNAIILKKLKPIYIQNYISRKYNAPISVDMEHFFSVVEETEAKGIVLTYPNYYGIAFDLKALANICHSRGMKVLVDCAHGAHFGITELLPENPIKLGADMAVMSAHKTLPSLTQTAFLHVKDKENIDKCSFYVSSFSTTSPSYIFMASMDYARDYLDAKGKKEFEQCIEVVKEYKSRINKETDFYAWEQGNIQQEYSKLNLRIDESRIIISPGAGYNCHKILSYLRNSRVQAEMTDGYNIVFIASPFNTREDYDMLLTSLMNCPLEEFRDNQFSIYMNNIPEKALEPWEVFERENSKVELDEAEGKISAVNIVPYPPGVPIIMMGEIIDKEALGVVKYYLKNEASILGVEDNKIKIVI
ncbi:aminotransferase class I/II-fold pyridoxal phosphate-dependent enzyme [Clostridium sp. 19966]|uniref:aminotransferase class I/II-fold pyridoxal phosphate-dependent enzyme n=1 Tax=Clostridium sp. 19966 TaxID=2768166 RepID=UPI0028E03CA2|nr:aminotransferase class I/II-fold pyridoxal phosphate-dependent enzyme [Clostridium sp. 19966]MDT8715776.1 aminotransferase class I/II-fold pyridoxal phosphate-dependent enzyme [Clostridium sp. 19966]